MAEGDLREYAAALLRARKSKRVGMVRVGPGGCLRVHFRGERGQPEWIDKVVFDFGAACGGETVPEEHDPAFIERVNEFGQPYWEQLKFERELLRREVLRRYRLESR